MDIIIGAGVTGLSYAMFSPNKSLVIEKDESYGGYCKTIKKDGFVWDYSGHFFHFQDPKIKDIVLSKISSEDLIEVRKVTKIKYKDLYIDFPFQKNIHQLPKEEFIDCLYDLYFASHSQSTSFKDMVYSKLGHSISEKFLIPYNEKLYACDLNKLDPDAMGRFFPKCKIDDVIGNFKKSDNSSYNDTFIYPKGGAIQYIDSIASQITRATIQYKSIITNIDPHKHIAYINDIPYEYEHLISTMPFNNLLELCGIQFNHKLYSNNKVLVYNLGFDRKGVDRESSWIYFPEDKFSFYRVGYYDNIMKTDKMSLYVEIGFPENAIIDDKMLEVVLVDLKNAGIINNEKLISYSSVIMNPGYVHISTMANNDIQKHKNELASFDIYSIGRYGSWTYCSIEDNIKEAKLLVDKLY